MLKFYEFLNENSSKNSIIEEILKSIENDIEQMVNSCEAQYIKSENERNEKLGQNTICNGFNSYQREMTRLDLIFNLSKSIECYTNKTDILVSVNTSLSSRGATITSIIQRDGISYKLDTESIGAGGYNIQTFHFRYITKTNLPKTGNVDITNLYKEKIKKMSKLEKFNSEIESFQKNIIKCEDTIIKNSPKTDKEIFDILSPDDRTMLITWETLNPGSHAKLNNTKESWEKQNKEYIEQRIKMWKHLNIVHYENWKKALEKNIEKLNSKIKSLI